MKTKSPYMGIKFPYLFEKINGTTSNFASKAGTVPPKHCGVWCIILFNSSSMTVQHEQGTLNSRT